MRSLTIIRLLSRTLARLCLVAVASTSAAAQAGTTDSLSNAAERALATKDWPAAARTYQRVVARSPNDGTAWFYLGVAQQARGKLDSAAMAFERTISIGPPAIGPQLRLARVRSSQRDARAAVRVLDGIRNSSLGGQFSPLYLTQQPDFDPIRTDSGFVRLVETLETLRYPCRANPRMHDLDFWIGRWAVTPPNGGQSSSEVSPIDAHCTVLEKWTDQFGGTGTSMNFFDPDIGKWRQLWVSDAGVILEYTGSFHDDAMWYDSVRPSGTGPKRRLVLHRLSADTVRQVFESSADDGKSWSESWSGLYVRRPAP